MLEINYNRFIQIVNNIDNIYNDKNSIEYKYINKYVSDRKLTDKSYNLFKLLDFIKNGLIKNKGSIYKLSI